MEKIWSLNQFLIEISSDDKTLYFFWSPTVNGSKEKLLDITTGTNRTEWAGDDPTVFVDPRFFDLQKGAKGGSVDGEISFTMVRSGLTAPLA